MAEQRDSSARAVFARLREENPQIAETERALGSRLTVARNVLRLRMRCGYTQRRLAEELGVTQPRIAQIEGAEANLQLDTLDRLAAFFGVDPAALLMKEDDTPASVTRALAALHADTAPDEG